TWFIPAITGLPYESGLRGREAVIDPSSPLQRDQQEPVVKGETQKTRRKNNAAAKNGDTFKKLRVMVLCHEDLVPPDSVEGLTPKEIAPFKTEWDVISTLKKMGHEVSPVGVYNNLGVIGNAILEYKPQVAFNLLEEFHGYPLYDQHVVSYLELMKQPYTGCNPR